MRFAIAFGKGSHVQIHIIRTSGITVLQCDGRLVLGRSATEFRRAALRALADTQVVALDLTGIRQMDAHGIGVLALLYGSSRDAGSTLLLAGASHRVQRLLGLARLDAIIPAVKTVLDADGEAPLVRHRADTSARTVVATRRRRPVAQRVSGGVAER